MTHTPPPLFFCLCFVARDSSRAASAVVSTTGFPLNSLDYYHEKVLFFSPRRISPRSPSPHRRLYEFQSPTLVRPPLPHDRPLARRPRHHRHRRPLRTQHLLHGLHRRRRLENHRR